MPWGRFSIAEIKTNQSSFDWFFLRSGVKKGRCHRCCKELDAYPRFLSLEDPFLLIESVCMHFGSRSSSSDGSDCEVVQICQATIIKEASISVFAGWCWCWFKLTDADFLWEKNIVGWLNKPGWNQQANMMYVDQNNKSSKACGWWFSWGLIYAVPLSKKIMLYACIVSKHLLFFLFYY